MKKSLRIEANIGGWYTIKVGCDEGTIITNVRLEANKPIDLSFVNNRPSLEHSVENKDKNWNKSQGKNNHRRFK